MHAVSFQTNIFDGIVSNDVERPSFKAYGRIIVFDGLRAVYIDRQRIKLTLKEYELLVFFLRQPLRIFTRPHLLSYVWGVPSFSNTNTVDVHVSVLRNKLKKFDLNNVIETVYGIGYLCNLDY